MTDSYTIRRANLADEAAILALLPDLADFDVPPKRNPDDLWQSDAALASKVLRGTADQSVLFVADDGTGKVLGLTLTTFRPDLMSGAPSAHLEAIVVSSAARGLGLGRALLGHCEAMVREQGAASLSLHVFNNNVRARTLYAAEGFDLELIRATKWLD
ncbi:MAG: GNAT family N-acetyltransferase [Pseudomonadota bacterium]